MILMLDLQNLPSNVPPPHERKEGYEYFDAEVDVNTKDNFRQFLIPYLEEILKDQEFCDKLGIEKKLR